MHVFGSKKREVNSCGFQSEIIAVVNDQRYNAKSILNTPLIDYAKSVDFSINGEDEETAEMAIKKRFGLRGVICICIVKEIM